MWEWVSGRPQRCLKFGTDSIAWAEAEWNWRGGRRRRCVMSPLSDGMVKPSPTDENVSEPSALANSIRMLTSSGQIRSVPGGVYLSELPRRAVILLPDTAVKTTVLHFDRVPARLEEREALIRWRLGQEQLFPLNGAKVVSQVLSDHGERTGGASAVLTVAVQESVLHQYESLCASVGLIPQEVGITSLRLFDLWKKVTGRSSWKGRDLLWVNLCDRALTTMICQQGQLLFYRCKLLGGEVAELLAKTDMLQKVVEECGTSLDVCHQQYPSLNIREAVMCADGDAAVLQEQIENELKLSVEQLGWKSVEALGWVANGNQRGVTSLAAMAGVP